VSLAQTVFGVLLVAALLVLSLFYGWRQVRALRGLRRAPGLPDEEARYERHRGWRRLVSCALMLLLAGLLAGALAYLEGQAQRYADMQDAVAAGAPPREPTDDETRFLLLYGRYWIGLLLVLLAVVLLAALDLWATRRYGLQQHRKLAADRRAMIQRQVERMRGERNGHR
jgi:hypothetical protein